MQVKSILLGLACCATLAACEGSDLERGVIGAGIGAATAASTGYDPVTGAAIGGAAGVVCDDLTPQVCQNN